ncbi:Uncharacterised protein [Mycobacteroides abscessus subsp. abscessus]|nr:Uncharacterised protein [Mycobacteroides abscessus subsp. abscessus]SHX00770.1 Uncharacterised protein [Mycobacteroides abscessus subsp. abscessus]SHX49572.1 Uncharacterised protein [Mycobacteroides abscessus subsp. abscessus]SHZ46065.1 Uncharacterised protein [Mycobacteroides abscessus subsp. abscessus]SHZ49249.1 Uncharacterised protein [Mycobacteroides abscessus subsp. abscessus]
MPDLKRAIAWACDGWERANKVASSNASSSAEQELGLALAAIAYAVVELAGGND